MHNRRKPFYWRALGLSVLAAVLAFTLVTVPVDRPALAQTELLTNGGFETAGANGTVAAGWSAWNIPVPANAPGYVGIALYRQTRNAARVVSGSAAQEMYEFFAIYDGGVYQTVNTTAGTSYQFSTSVYIWSTALEDEDVSAEPSPVTVQIGIDPSGGTNGSAASVQYSAATPYQSADYDKYRAFTKTVTATGSKVTVFIRVAFTQPVQSNHVYIDNASLRATGAAQPTTVPNNPTATGTATVTRTATARTGSATPTVIITREGTVTTPTPSATVVGAVSFTPVPATTQAPAATVTASATAIPVTVEAPTLIPTVEPPTAIPTLITPVTATLFVPSPQPVDPNPTAIPLFPSPTVPTSTPVPTNTPIPTATPIISPTAPVDVIPLTGPTVNGIGTYIIQPGDRFEAVAARYKITVAELARLNGIVNPSRIAIGQVLVVPGPGNNYPGGTAAPTSFPTPTAAPATSFNYTVQPGDYLISLAARYGVTPESILQLNGITNANLLYVGQVIRIPIRPQ